MSIDVIEELRKRLGVIMFDPDAERIRGDVERAIKFLDLEPIDRILVTWDDPRNDSSDAHVILLGDRYLFELVISVISKSVSISGWLLSSLDTIRFELFDPERASLRCGAAGSIVLSWVVDGRAAAKELQGLAGALKTRIASEHAQH